MSGARMIAEEWGLAFDDVTGEPVLFNTSLGIHHSLTTIEASNALVSELAAALRAHQAFWDAMPKGQLGRISCDIGLLNQAFLQTSAVLRKVKS